MASKIGTPGSKASDNRLLALPACGELTILGIAVDCMLTSKAVRLGLSRGSSILPTQVEKSQSAPGTVDGGSVCCPPRTVRYPV